MSSFQIKNHILCEILFPLQHSDRNEDTLINYLTKTYSFLNDDRLDDIKRKLAHSFIPTFKSKYHSAFRNESTFKKKYKNWLSSDFTVDFHKIGKIGRPRSENVEESSRSTKYRKVQSITEMFSTGEIKKAFYKNLKDSGKQHLIATIEKLLEDDTPSEFFDDGPVSFTDNEALALIEDAKLSKWQYDTIRKQISAKNANILIPFKKLATARDSCYPEASSILISDKGVKIGLQALLNHTCTRILQIPEVAAKFKGTSSEVLLTMTYKWGCDGASSHSQYKQTFSDGTIATTDESIFMISIVPLSLEVNDHSNRIIVWSNFQPGSPRHCRPVSFEYAKETPEKIIQEVNDMKSEINLLLPTNVVIENVKLKVFHSMKLTMIDGKVRQALTGTPSSASCCICQAKPSEMNDLKKLSQKIEIKENCEYGLSSLHAWIRFFECILHIAYRLDFCKWKASTEKQQDQMKQKREHIQKEFRKRNGLLVDYPQQGSGNSNDGNTARRFFRDPHLAAEVTGVNQALIERFSVILQTIASGNSIDSVKFDSYAKETAKLYLRLYSWYYMPPSVHLILFHGANIMNHFLLIPIGLLSEEAQESRNKDVKHIREFNTRKCSRKATNTDLIHKLLISSDPMISNLRVRLKQVKFELDKSAKNLLIL